MKYQCPHCDASLKRRLVRSVPLPGERKFLPNKVGQACPDCGQRIEVNQHPLEQKMIWLLAPLALFFLWRDAIPSPRVAMILFISLAVVFALTTIYLERRYLRNWPRYKRYEEMPDSSTRADD